MSLRPIFFSVLIILTEDVYSLEFKPRAREYYEVIKLQTGANHKIYRGLSNIINFWHEVPRDFALGFALGSIGSPYKLEGSSQPSISFRESFRLHSVGLEYKKWYAKRPFLRLGTYHNSFQMGGNVPESGYSNYVGLGWEFDCQGVGIAAEIGQKLGVYGGRWKLNSRMFALGFHFYKN